MFTLILLFSPVTKKIERKTFFSGKKNLLKITQKNPTIHLWL